MSIIQHTHQDPGIKRDTEGHFMETRGSVYQEGIIIDMNVADKRKKGLSSSVSSEILKTFQRCDVHRGGDAPLQ